jgi:hypothetical protein
MLFEVSLPKDISTMKNPSRLTVVALLALVHCGGSTMSPVAGDPPDGSASSSSTGSSSSSNLPGGDPDAACSSRPAADAAARAAPANHRAEAAACAPGRTNCAGGDAGGGQACSSDADCAAPDGSFTYFTHCLHGQCSGDACLADSDCASDQVCACSSLFYGGNGCFHPNVCVPANCHVDGDCGPGGFCSPSLGYCGTIGAYYCQKPTDPCVDPTIDCSCSGFQPAACTYSPANAEWVCAAGSVCAG